MVLITDKLIPSQVNKFELRLEDVKKITAIQYAEKTEKITEIDMDGKARQVGERTVIDVNTALGSITKLNPSLQNLFLDFLAVSWIDSVKETTTKMEDAEERVFEFIDLELGKVQEEYEVESNAKKMLKEVRDCLSHFKEVISDCNIPASIGVLESKGYLETEGKEKILTETIMEKMKDNTMKDIESVSFLKDVLEEDYTKEEPRKKVSEKRLERAKEEYENSQNSENPMSEKDYEDKIERIKRQKNRQSNTILNAADKSKPLFNPKFLTDEVITVSRSKKKDGSFGTQLIVKIDTYEYLRQWFISENLGDMDIKEGEDAFIYYKRTNLDSDNEEYNEKNELHLKNMSGKKQREWYNWFEKMIVQQDRSKVRDAKNKRVFENEDKYNEYIDGRKKEILEAQEEAKKKSLEIINREAPDLQNISEQLYDLIVNTKNTLKGNITVGEIEDLHIILGEVHDEQGSSSAGDALEEELTEKQDFSKSLLKSILKTVDIIKKSKKEVLLVTENRKPKGAMLLLERNFTTINNKALDKNGTIKMGRDYLETLSDEERKNIDKEMDELFASNENTIVETEYSDKERIQYLLSNDRGNLMLDFISDNITQDGSIQGGGYTLYSVISNKTFPNLSTDRAFNLINEELDKLRNPKKFVSVIKDYLKSNMKPIKGLADIKSDIQKSLTPVDNQLKVGTLILTYDLGTGLEKALKSKKDFEKLIGDSYKKYLFQDKEKDSEEKFDKITSDKGRTAVTNISNIVEGTNLIIDDLNDIISDTMVFRYEGDEVLRDDNINQEDVRALIISNFLGTPTKNNTVRAKTLATEITRNLKSLNRKIINLENKYDVNIQNIINKEKELTSRDMRSLLYGYEEEIKNLGLPLLIFENKTGGFIDEEGKEYKPKFGEFNRPDMEVDSRIYKKYFEVRKKDFMLWFGELSTQEAKNLDSSELLLQFHSRLQVDSKEEIKELFTFRPDEYTGLYNYIMSEDEYNKLKTEEAREDSAEKAIVDLIELIEKAFSTTNKVKLFNDFKKTEHFTWFMSDNFKISEAEKTFPSWSDGFKNYIIDIKENALNEETPLKVLTDSDITDSDLEKIIEDIKEAQEYKPSRYDKETDISLPSSLTPSSISFGEYKQLLKASDIYSADEDILYWIFLWMSKTNRIDTIESFAKYSKMSFSFDNYLKVPIQVLLDPDRKYRETGAPITRDGLLDVNQILSRYKKLYLEEIFTEKIESKDFLDKIEDISFIVLMREKKNDFKLKEELDFNPFGQSVDPKIKTQRGGVRRKPEQIEVEVGGKNKDGTSKTKFKNKRTDRGQRNINNQVFLNAKKRYNQLMRRL